MASTNVLIGGFCCSTAGYEPLRAAMSRAGGSEVLFIGSDRWRRMLMRPMWQYPRCMYRQAEHVAATLRRSNITRARLFGHSMGGIVALIVADAFPDLVEEVILLNSAGVYADGSIKLGWRFGRKVWGDLKDARHHPDEAVRIIVRTCVKGAWPYVVNLVRSTAESLTLSTYRALHRLHPRLEVRGIPVRLCSSDGDIVFVADRVTDAARHLNITPLAFEGLPHDMQYHPELTVQHLQTHGLL